MKSPREKPRSRRDTICQPCNSYGRPDRGAGGDAEAERGTQVLLFKLHEAGREGRAKSIAFCCISTGEFHFPNKLAAQIAVETVDRYLSSSKLERVIFNVFKEEDYNIYKKLLQ